LREPRGSDDHPGGHAPEWPADAAQPAPGADRAGANVVDPGAHGARIVETRARGPRARATPPAPQQKAPGPVGARRASPLDEDVGGGQVGAALPLSTDLLDAAGELDV